MSTSFAIPRPTGGTTPLRRGFSLVELLVASMLSLLVMGSVAALFAEFGRSVSDGRAMTELNTRTRNAAWRLRQDLSGLTCLPAPRVPIEANAGYFHVIEGSNSSATGDWDDVLAFTTSSPSSPFAGRLAGADGFESPVAEVIWFCESSGTSYKGTTLYNLHRRQLLVAATPDAGSFAANPFFGGSRTAVWATSDLSFGQHANGLSDLSIRANRFLGDPTPSAPLSGKKLIGTREGEDVILGNVVAFNVTIIRSGTSAAANGSFETSHDGLPREEGNAATQPLRGVVVQIRCLEPSSGQIRELKVVHSFSAL
jgi:prepilin-type N-terminal cleavage/methylation domain-containing protein